MTGRIILGVVLALILLFLFSNVRLVFRYDNGEVFLQARWLFIRYQILPEPEKRKKKGAGDEKKESTNGPPAGQGSALEREKAERDNQNPHGKKQESQSNSPKTPGRTGAGTAKDSVGELSQKGKETEKKAGVRMADQESRTLQATIEQVLDLLRAAKKPLKLLYRHLWVRRLDFRLVVAREDAAQTAIAYGRMNGWVHGAYAAISQFVRMKKGRVLVQGDYLSQQDRLQASFVLTLRVLFLLAAGIRFVARFLWKTLKNSRAAGDAALTSSAKAAQQRKREGKRDKEENSCPN